MLKPEKSSFLFFQFDTLRLNANSTYGILFLIDISVIENFPYYYM